MKTKIPVVIVSNELIKFLKNRNILNEFIAEADFDTVEYLETYIAENRAHNHSDSSLIDFAFSWEDTERGSKFWARINDEWDEEIYKAKSSVFSKINLIW